MSILVVGSVAFDTLTTPSGSRTKVLGGAATHFSLAASFFTDVRVVGVVGKDFLPEHEAVMTSKGIDTSGIEHADGLSFHWTGSYEGTMGEAKTLGTDLNVFGSFDPKIPASYKDTDYLFLANIDPVLQLRVRQAMPDVKMVAGDTMNYWIADHRANLDKVLAVEDILIINDGEARLLTGEHNLVTAAKKVMAMGPKSLVIKHGEYGATAFFSDRSFEDGGVSLVPFRAPALPIESVVDPTGAGDSFAGGFYGYIASQPKLTPRVFRTALFYGGVMGSFAVERFGTERLENTTREEIDERFGLFRQISHLDLDAA
ncbi:sugar kinase, ribokinase [Terriglobus roseus DSM 18391]|uniref:Sugar kinase, ribokinase n=1 Tax=Terriglobus roseus (strain DSM 18391 / NRRL B-41598 / KBS 63) TaxID=926566 RepID=I3ZL68_TERRK|nr:PfkB family carbohydrate kinase [Terriglobus roseus]AFL89986.1 sugar kinase, ribokinase [Terriglobus roseus DSM 18391]